MTKRELKVTLETVTPLFLAGADNRKPELRPPSVRGQLRYWLRAALGAVVGDDLTALKKAESEVFGNTDGTGAVGVRTSQPRLSILEEVNPLPHKNTPTRFAGFDAEQTFEIQLTQRGFGEGTWLASITALLLMVSFGGLGRRVRRGWGSLRIVNADTSQASLNEGWREVFASRPPDSAGRWFDYLSIVLEVAQLGIEPLSKDLNIKRKSVPVPPTPYTIASPKLVQPIIVKKVYPTYTEAIKDFGQKEHKFGTGSAFGNENPRQGSPLWVRVLPVSKPQQGYVLAMSFFDTKFDGRDEKRIYRFLSQWESVKVEVPR